MPLDPTFLIALVVIVVLSLIIAACTSRSSSTKSSVLTSLGAGTKTRRRPNVKGPLILPDGDLIFFDVETDPNRSFIWLIGAYVKTDPPTFKQFIARSLSEEKSIIEAFVNFSKNYPDAVLCYYAGIKRFDEDLVKRRLRHYGLASEFLVMKDLFYAIRRSFAVKKYSLKYVGMRFGYEFKHPELNGRAVAKAYRRYLKKGNEGLLQRLMEYNEDDVKALSFIIDRASTIPNLKIVKRPVIKRKVEKIEENLYRVSSFRLKRRAYIVDLSKRSCTCPSFQSTSIQCKHIRLVLEQLS